MSRLDKRKIYSILVLYRTVLISTNQKEAFPRNDDREFLTNIRRISSCTKVGSKPLRGYRLTLIEATIISFLQNNPGKDTAADIVELRMLSKGNVSQAVESLMQKALLRREPGYGGQKADPSFPDASRRAGCPIHGDGVEAV